MPPHDPQARADPISCDWRDISVASQHIANIPNVGFEVYGKVLPGMEPNIMMPHMIRRRHGASCAA